MTDQELIRNLRDLTEYADGCLVWKESYRRRVKGSQIGTLHSQGYREASLNSRRYLVHTLVFAYHHGYLPKMVDHIDGNKLNNRIENLRECTHRENGYNSKRRTDNTSGHKNVSWSKTAKKWGVRMKINKVYTNLGFYDDFDLACLVADEARSKYHKEFANNGSKIDS